MQYNEIVEIADKKGIKKEVIDKDWILSHFLNAIYTFTDIQENFVFKGGTCLKKCYFEDYRFSEDLDFTLLDTNFIVDTSFVNKIIEIAEHNSGAEFHLNKIKPQIHKDIPQGYEVEIGFWGAYHKPNQRPLPANRWQTKIKLDISFSEQLFEAPVYREIFHPYSDSFVINKTIPVYPMVEIMAEKLRSLIQRNRPRDIYDIWYIMQSTENINNKAIIKLLLKKAEAKNIEIVNVDQFVNPQKMRKNKRAWESSIKQHLPINALPDFDMVYSQLKLIIENVLKA
ncbi:MAG: nucleotidyl transferase AbiEii/AbiGii toxin family protein [Bacteroidales bacterium]|nr:nucleotidyl transferase AbiEii/AbiGii toxin family protein [Bacteroidales bacterium]